MGLQSPVRLAPYDQGREVERVTMWRESFEFGVAALDAHPFDEQVGYFRDHVLPSCEVRIALDGPAFVVERQGFEPHWQLDDVLYRWQAPASAARS